MNEDNKIKFRSMIGETICMLSKVIENNMDPSGIIFKSSSEYLENTLHCCESRIHKMMKLIKIHKEYEDKLNEVQ